MRLPAPASLAKDLDRVGLKAEVMVSNLDGTAPDQSKAEAILACYDAEHARPVSDQEAAASADAAMNPGRRVKSLIRAKVARIDGAGHLQYAVDSRKARLAHIGEVGSIVDRSTGHGVCFELTFANGTTAWYDPCELELC